MKKTTLIAFSTLCLNLNAQTSTDVKGIIRNEQLTPMHKIEVSLYTCKDTVLIAQTKTDNKGLFSLKNETGLDAFIVVSNKGYKPVSQQVKDNDNISITLEKDETKQLGEAVVSITNASTIKREKGKFVFTPKGLDLNNASAYDMLRNVPLLDMNEAGVEIMGKGQSTIYINGRKPTETGVELINKIRSIRPDQIAKIEIITNPGASHNASTQGGIVNVVIKRNDIGWAGDISTQVRFPSEGSNATLSPSLRYGKEKFNASFYLNVGGGKQVDRTHDYYKYFDLGKDVTERTKVTDKWLGGSLSGDLSYDISPSQVIGVSGNLGSISFGKTRTNVNTTTLLSDASTEHAMSDISQKDHSTNKLPFSALAYYTWKTDKKGSKLDVSVDGSRKYRVYNKQTVFADIVQGITTPNADYTQPSHRDAHAFNATIKYNWEVNDDNSIGLGYETNNSESKTFRNTIVNTNRDNYNFDDDGLFSYKENIHAAYLNYDRTWSKHFSSSIGLRGENSNVKYKPSTSTQTIQDKRFDLYPSVTLDFNIVNNKHSLSLEYSKKVSRMFISAYSTFVNQTSSNSYSVGGGNLDPMRTHNISAYYTLLKDYIFNVSLDKSTGVNADYTYQDDNGKTITSKMETEADYGANINFTMNKVLFKGLWMLQASLSGSYDKTEVAHNNFDGTNFNMHEWSGSFSLFNIFRLSKDRSWVARCFMYASTGSKGLTKKFNPKLNLSLMLSKAFKFGGTLQLEYMNLLFTQSQRKWNYTNEKYMHNYYGKNPQQIVVSFSMPFGKSRIRGAAYKNSDKLSSRLGK